jgi:hypothetical protein
VGAIQEQPLSRATPTFFKEALRVALRRRKSRRPDLNKQPSRIYRISSRMARKTGKSNYSGTLYR